MRLRIAIAIFAILLAGLALVPIVVASCNPPPPTVTIASLTAQNTSAAPNYNQTNFPINFGAQTYVTNTNTIAIDPTKQDLSGNWVSPGHVSNVSVHTLLPAHNVRWFAHVMAGWWQGSAPTNAATGAVITIGYNQDTDAQVGAIVEDLIRRGFDGAFLVWNGNVNGAIGDHSSDSIAQRFKNYIAANHNGTFKYAILIDQGLVAGCTTTCVSLLQNAITYLSTRYFTDPNYETEAGKAFLPMYGVGDSEGDANMQTVKNAVGAGQYWGHNGTGHINAAWDDFAFDWTDNFQNYGTTGYNPADPYNTAALNGFYTSLNPAKGCMAAMNGGFDGTLGSFNGNYGTAQNTSWSLGKYLPQNSGAAVIARAAYINTNMTSNCTRVQWATWSDWAEGSPLEPGYENSAVVTASVAGTSVNWTITTGTGDETTIDHYEVYTSADGVNAADRGPVAAGTHTFSLSGLSGLVSGTTYQVMVYAVGKPSIRNHLSNSVNYVAP